MSKLLVEDKKNSACPICGKPAQSAFTPFCSKRCADVDLARWFGGRYAVPATETDDEAKMDGEEDLTH